MLPADLYKHKLSLIMSNRITFPYTGKMTRISILFNVVMDIPASVIKQEKGI